jgi:Zn-dependent protease with chaperone function
LHARPVSADHPAMSIATRDRLSLAMAAAVGAALLAGGTWYATLLAPLVEPAVVVWLTGTLIGLSVAGGRGFVRMAAPLDPARPSTPVLERLVRDLADRTGMRMPRLAFDDSQLARAVANVGAVEMGPNTATIVFTEQVVADLEAGRFDPRSLRGVILHELGHLYHDHSYQRLWLSIGERFVRVAAIAAFGAVLVSRDARRALEAQPELGLAILVGPLVVASVMGVLARAQETQADAFAVRHAAGRELLSYLHWMLNDLGPLIRLDRSGIPADPAERSAIRHGLERLIAEAEAVADKERADFLRLALNAVERREREAALGPEGRLVARLGRLVRSFALAWLGMIPAARTHPPVEDRIARIGAELGESAA